MLCSVYSVFIVPTDTLRLPWLRFFRAFSSVVRQMLGYNPQRCDTARTLPKLTVLFVCKCVLYHCHRVSTQLQLNISYHIIKMVMSLSIPWKYIKIIEVYLHSFLTSTLDGNGQLHVPHTICLGKGRRRALNTSLGGPKGDWKFCMWYKYLALTEIQIPNWTTFTLVRA